MNTTRISGGAVARWALIICLCAAARAGQAQEVPASQRGLPPELIVPTEPPLEEQAKVLEAIVGAAEGQKKGGGFLHGLKNMFAGKPQVVVVTVPDLVENAEHLRQAQVEVHGVVRTPEGKLRFAAEPEDVEIDLAGGVKPEGFPSEDLNWLPGKAKGIVELPFDKPVLHALNLVPSAPLARLRLARVLEEQGKYREALEQYEKAAMELRQARLDWAAFAASEAGWIAYHKLRNGKLASRTLNAAWGPYTVKGRDGRPLFYTWVQKPDGSGWEKKPVAEAIGPLLDRASRESFWYRLVDFFVSIAGGQAALGVILLALVTRLVLHPLTRKQLESMEAMRRLQPQVQALQEKYKDDKQKFQQELWRLWQENGVNPFGGCWPMLIQMPILIMVYQGIRGYIVRFSQSGFLWIRDLSMPDLPLLIAYTLSMVAFQQITSKMQPTTDPQQKQQQQMMNWMMPLMFFFFFRSLPSAFILYWLASNLIYFGEQWIYRRQVEKAGGLPKKPRKPSRFMEAMMKAAEQSAKGGGASCPLAPKPKKQSGQGKSGSGSKQKRKKK